MPVREPRRPSRRCGRQNRPSRRRCPPTSARQNRPSPRTVSTDPGAVAATGRAPSASACEPYRELIAEALGRGRNAMAIWQDLVDDHGFAARYASVRRFVAEAARRARRPRRASSSPRRPAKKARSTTARGPMVRDPSTGKYRRMRLFVLTLGYSRKSVRLLTWRSSAQIWAELHERAFRRLGGTVKVIVLDNLGEGVLTPDIYDPALNPLYRDVLAHYGVVALPCRVRRSRSQRQSRSRRRPRAEDAAEGPALRDDRGGAGVPGSLGGALGRHAHPRHDEAPGRRDVCRGTAGARPAPASNRFATTASATARSISMAASKSRRAYYGAPPGWIGQRVQVQWNDLHVRLLAPKTGQLLREHLRTRRGWYRIHDDDRPARTPPSTLALLGARRPSAGPHIGTRVHAHPRSTTACRASAASSASSRSRRNTAPAVVEDAAKAALEIGVPTYRFLRKYVERRPPVPLTLRQVDPLIRQLTLYRDLIDRKTGDPP